jgi:lipopolysaccharide/colanic/teichoic acid biosynthesis glycosyltransferase
MAYIERVMHDKIKLQKQYIAERSLLVDCKIILATIGRIISTRLLPERRELDAV